MLQTPLRSEEPSIRASVGHVFDAVAPDFHFGYHAAALTDRLAIWDASPIFHHALDRSNGHSVQNGRGSPDTVDYLSRLGTVSLQTPFPHIMSIANVAFHEYNMVARETGSPKFRPLQRSVVATALRREAGGTKSRELRRTILDALDDDGGGAPSPRGSVADMVGFRSRQLLGRLPADQLPRRLTTNPRVLPYLRFKSKENAMAAVRETSSIKPRSDLPGVVTVVTPHETNSSRDRKSPESRGYAE